MLDIPSCSKNQWLRIVEWSEKHVTQWSCEQVRSRGDHQQWIASYDGFYLTRGHYSINSSAMLHDYSTGGVAWSLIGPRGATDMLDELLEKVKAEGFIIKEIVTDKDSSGNAIFCNHFPEGSITYCSNHSAKTLHKQLHKIKPNKYTVSTWNYESIFKTCM